jgi:hypothetical protein
LPIPPSSPTRLPLEALEQILSAPATSMSAMVCGVGSNETIPDVLTISYPRTPRGGWGNQKRLQTRCFSWQAKMHRLLVAPTWLLMDHCARGYNSEWSTSSLCSMLQKQCARPVKFSSPPIISVLSVALKYKVYGLGSSVCYQEVFLAAATLLTNQSIAYFTFHISQDRTLALSLIVSFESVKSRKSPRQPRLKRGNATTKASLPSHPCSSR